METTRIDISLTFPVFFLYCKKWLHMFCLGKMVAHHLNNTFSFERKKWYSLEVQQLGSQLCGLLLKPWVLMCKNSPWWVGWLQLILWKLFTLFFWGGGKMNDSAYVSNGLAGGQTHPTNPRPRGVQIFTSWNFEKEVEQIPAAPNKKGRTVCCCWPGVELQE